MASPVISYNPTYKSRANDFTGYQDITYTAKAIGMILKNQSFLVPIGSVHQYAGSLAPNGYLICDGSAISRSIYTELFNIIGTTYGVGDGSTTFNVPNLKARVAVGRDATVPYSATLGQTGGEEKHQLTIAEMPSHTHTGTTNTDGQHVHDINDPGHSHSLPLSSAALTGVGPSDDVTQGSGYTTGSNVTGISVLNTNSAHAHAFTTNSTGGDSPHNNLQPYLVMNYIIKYT